MDNDADNAIGSVRDEMWKVLGRPRESTHMDEVFPGGVTTYTSGDPRTQPVRMQILDCPGLPFRAKRVFLGAKQSRSFIMAYDHELAARIRARMDDPLGVSERAMFGGLVFLVYGNMCVGIVGRDLMVRVGPEAYQKMLAEPFVRPMDFTGKPLQGFIYVDADGVETDTQLDVWLDRARAFVSTLPPKDSTKKSAPQKSTGKPKSPRKSSRRAL